MRKHGWQIPYHPLQVVAVAVFMALGFAFYVFFAPFVGKKLLQYIAMGLYTPLIICVIGLYIWCAASDPADPGVFKSKKYLRAAYNKQSAPAKESNLGGDSGQDATVGDKTFDKNIRDAHVAPHKESCFSALCGIVCNSSDRCEKSSKQHTSEDGMYYCSLCEVEVFKYSKHCRVCDKCVDHFDHHCRWINNCIGKRNYWKFFTLMVSALLLLILQWSTGILVLICCFIEKKRFYVNITSNLGSSFSLVPFVVVVAVCTILAMIATLPIAQLFFFHILLIRKGLSTYDYVIALREQDQQGVEGQQSPQMSTVSSLNGLSSASSFNAFHRASWCTPPPLFAEDHQFDVVPPENASVSSLGRKTQVEEAVKKKSRPAVKISPWTLARLNSEDVSRAAAEARSKSKILQPVGPSGAQTAPRSDNNKRRPSKRTPLHPAFDLALTNDTSQAQPGLGGMVISSPESSLASPDLRLSSSGLMTAQKETPLSASTSDGYDASGGEDSDRVPTRFVQRSAQWSALLLGSSPIERDSRLMLPSSSSSQSNIISRI